MQHNAQLQTKMANAIRILSADAVEQAKSGHPGAPMGMAEIALVLWTKHLRHNPANPQWCNRDRFVLSNGHGSMLLYSLLHLSGYDLSIDAIRNFRQLHSGTPGHPEVDITPGVETTTGPLGQGLANAVGMALAENLLAKEFNRDGHNPVDHHTYVFVGDGCLMEGISHEACSLAGTLGLGKLMVFYDDNGISIDGKVDNWYSDNTPQRFRSYGWHVIEGIDGHNTEAIDKAIEEAKQQIDKPTLLCCKTIIGKGAPNKAGGEKVHGAPLGAEEIAAMRKELSWEHPPFEIPQEIYNAWNAQEKGQENYSQWQQAYENYASKHPQLAAEYRRRIKGEMPASLDQNIAKLAQEVIENSSKIATRKASQNALTLLAPHLPELFGGSADLTGSNLTNFNGCTQLVPGNWGNHISWGVREFAMAAAMNGIALHGGYIPYGGTFLTFSDYSRNAIRMAALMNRRVIHVFTHDSIGLGEDGPTHQSVEQLPSLRIIPNLYVWRPADELETLAAWYAAINRKNGPTALGLSRQGLPAVHTTNEKWQQILRGGYVLSNAENPVAILIATGSEVHLALEAQQQLSERNIQVRVVSMPCTQAFDSQSETYRKDTLPEDLPKIAIEASYPDVWHKYIQGNGKVIGIAGFGESAPADTLFKHYGITVNNIVESVLQLPVMA